MNTSKSPIERRIVRQTDKAILVTVTTMRSERDVWFPKSQVEVQGEIIWVADWLLTKKGEEVSPIITVSRTIAAQMIAA